MDVIYLNKVPKKTLAQMAELYIEVFTAPPRFERWTTDQAKSHLQTFLDAGGDGFIVEDPPGELVSFALGLPLAQYFNKEELLAHGARSDAYYFAELATKPSARRRGFGSALHRARESKAREYGFERINVRVRADNKANLRLLGRMGFRQVGTYTADLQGSRAVRLILEKDLGGCR